VRYSSALYPIVVRHVRRWSRIETANSICIT